ncbi:unnamed protein product [Staurois parvus]|uniref:Uncharacterized protein n=1 Tax=Staurois parvus TaxID=386267 RepID=A0ABN9FQQ0_9NEOB|nr:unnamed protein product [Staurois parvus]
MASQPRACARSLGAHSTAIRSLSCDHLQSSKQDFTSDIIAYYV